MLLPLAVLVGIPLAYGASGSTRPGDVAGGWQFVLWTLPDVGGTLLVLAIAPLALGAWELWAVGRGKLDSRRRRPAASA